MSTAPNHRRTADELLRRAVEFETMAAKASVTDTATALRRLAERYRAMAQERVGAIVQQPGEPAFGDGRYQLLNVFGTPIATTVDVKQGDPLPAAPRAFTWHLIEKR